MSLALPTPAQGHPIITRVALFFVALVIAALSVVVSPSAAHAVQDGGGVGGRLEVPSMCGNASKEAGVDYLPVFRWSGTTNELHQRYSKLDLTGAVGRYAQSSMVQTAFGFGNAMWNATTSMVNLANRACPLDAAAGVMDETAGKLGDALFKAGVIVLIVVVLIVSVVWRGYRNGGNFNFASLGPKVLLLGFIIAMIGGAQASTGAGIERPGSNPDAPYVAGTLSPGWVITTIDKVISGLAQAPVNVMMNDKSFDISGAGSGSGSHVNDCVYYVKALHLKYKETNKAAYVDVTGTSRALSAMWEQSGLEAWKNVQFGDKNSIGDKMYCYALESKTQVPVTYEDKTENGFTFGRMDHVMQKAKMGNPTSDMPIFARTSDGDTFDRQMVAFAQCKIKKGGKIGSLNENSFTVALLSDDESKKVSKKDCLDAYTPGKQLSDKFDWPARDNSDIGDKLKSIGTAGLAGGESAVSKYAKEGPEKNFLRALHGDGMMHGTLTALIYVASSFLVMCAFGLLAGAILLAKIYALVYLFAMVFVAIGSLLPNSDPGKFPKYLKQYAGLSFFIFGFQLLMAILAFLTKVLVELGTETVSNSEMQMLWVGMAPVLALVAMNMAFKKMGMPSPLSLNAGQAWGKAANSGAIGGAALTAGAAGAGAFGGNVLGSRIVGNAVGNALTDKVKDIMPAGLSGSKANKGKQVTERLGAQKGEERVQKRDAEFEEAADKDVVAERQAEYEKAEGLDKAQSGRDARREDRLAEMEEKGLTDKSLRYRAGHATGEMFSNAKEKFEEKFADAKNHPFKTAAKGAALAGAGAAAAGAGLALAPLAMTVGTVAGTTWAAKKGVSSVKTRLGFNDEANRQAFENNARRRAEAQRAADEADNAEQERLGRAFESENGQKEPESDVSPMDFVDAAHQNDDSTPPAQRG